VVVRPERPGDDEAIRGVHDAAFGGPAEGRIVDEVRGSHAWVPGLSLVAVDPTTGAIVGHVLMSRAALERSDAPAASVLVLGPIGVHPDHQGQGVGAMLMRRAIGAALATGEPLIALLGHASYYPRFGFERGRDLGIEPPAPWPDDSWLVLRLPAWTPDLRGRVRYPAAFGTP
jgi:putative acetyltransferase